MKKRPFILFLCLLPLLCGAQERRWIVRMPDSRETPAELRSAPLYGKTLVAFGDSYVRNQDRPVEETWHARIARKYNMKYYNCGVNGACLAYDRSFENFGPPLCSFYSELPREADYIIVVAGHNDAAMMFRLGEGPEFFRGRLDAFCTAMRERYPQAVICFVTPWANPLPQYGAVTEAILEVCGAHGIPVYDASRESGIHPDRRLTRLLLFQSPGDNAHLNARGHARMAPKMEKYLLGLRPVSGM